MTAAPIGTADFWDNVVTIMIKNLGGTQIPTYYPSFNEIRSNGQKFLELEGHQKESEERRAGEQFCLSQKI